MSHPTVETLSTYLDRELSGAQEQRLEEHLQHCDACRGRLQSLHRVSQRLQRIERQAPPAHLGLDLRSVARAEARPEPLRRRLAGAAAGRSVMQSSILPLFGVLVALISILYLLSSALGHLESLRQQTPTSSEMAEIEVTREIAGRTLDRHGDLWIERGLEQTPVDLRLRRDDPQVRRWSAEDPGLEEIIGLAGGIRLRWQGRIVEIGVDETE